MTSTIGLDINAEPNALIAVVAAVTAFFTLVSMVVANAFKGRKSNMVNRADYDNGAQICSPFRLSCMVSAIFAAAPSQFSIAPRTLSILSGVASINARNPATAF